MALVACLFALVAFSGSASAAGPAGTDNCNYDNAPLKDSLGREWDPNSQGVFGDGSDGDTFDQYVDLVVGGQHYDNSNDAACALEAGGREIVYPTLTLGGLDVQRKIFVPATGRAFARLLSVVHNPGTQPVKTNISLECDDDYTTGAPCPVAVNGVDASSSPLGSDSYTSIIDSSNGDGFADARDHWAISDDDDLTGGDNSIIHEWDGAGADDRADFVHLKGIGDDSNAGRSAFKVEWQNVTVPAGGTVIYMFVVAQRVTTADSPAAAADLATAPADLFVDMTKDEVSQTQNWCPADQCDSDKDGIPNKSDNCAAAANADQADIDGDGIGDVCDDDIDGDGLTNSREQALRTDPRKADTDGDGRKDGDDSCPTVAGTQDDGCPAPVVLPPPADKTPPVASIAIATKLSLKALLKKGLTVKVSSNEPTTFALEIVAAAKGAKLAKVGDLVISAKSLGQGSGTRTVKLTITKKWRKAIRVKSKLTLRMVATDAAGNRATSSKKLKLKK